MPRSLKPPAATAGGPARALSPWALICYSAPGVPAAMALYAVGVIAPGFYGSYVGLSATTLGLILLATRLTDVLFDFGAGALSDMTHSPWGRRKPWILGGAVALAASFYLLMTPAKDAGAGYFLWASVAFFLGWSLLNVPYDAWGSELAADYHSRASLFTYRAAASYTGSLLFSIIPVLPFFHSTEYSPDVLRFIACTAAVLLLMFVPLALAVTPKEARAPRKAPDLAGFVSALRRNRPLQIYIGSAVLNGLSDGVFTALVFIYQASYMGFGKQIWIILAVYVIASFLALPIWAAVVRRFGKHKAWAAGLFLTALCYPPMALLPPQASSLIPMLLLVALAGGTYSIANVASPAVLGDVVDYETLKSGASKGGAFFAVQALLNKFNVAVGGGIGFLLIGWFGYNPAAATHTAAAVFGIKFAHLFVPSLLKFGAIALIWRFPLNARSQSVIKRRLDRLAMRASS